MKINLNDISEDGLTLKIDDTSQETKDCQNDWWRVLLKDVFKEDYRPKEHAKLVLHIEKTCDNVALQGTAKIATHPTCARCVEIFEKKITVPIQVHLAPSLGGNESTLQDDLNFAFYQGDEIDLASILREIFLLEIPIRHLCKESCKGLCAQCGQNLNMKACSCKTQLIDPRWAALKNFDTKKLNKGK